MAKQKIKTDSVTLIWVCPECKEKCSGALTDIVTSGTAVCPDCDVDCELDDEIEVDDDESKGDRVPV